MRWMKNIDKILSMDAFYATQVTAFRQTTKTAKDPEITPLWEILSRNTGIILVIDEIDEEYWQEFIDRCILCHSSDGIPTCDRDR